MKRKLLSFAVAFMLLLQTIASAGDIYDTLQAINDGSGTLFDSNNRFSWTKKSGSVVSAPLTAEAALAGAAVFSPSIKLNNYGDFFDYKLSIDMTNVLNAFNTLYSTTTATLAGDAALGTLFENSSINGKFTIEVTYDDGVTPPSVAFTALTLEQPTRGAGLAPIYTVNAGESSHDETNRKVTVVVDAVTTVNALNTDKTMLDDLCITVPGWKSSVQSANVSAKMDGYTIIKEPVAAPKTSEEYAIIEYQSGLTSANIAVDTGSGKVSGGGGGGGSETSSPTVTGVFDDEEVIDIPVINVGGNYYIDTKTLPTKDDEDNPIFGWYEDPDFIVPIEPDKNGRFKVKDNTKLYFRTTPTAGAVVDGSVDPVPVGKNTDGTYSVDMNELPTVDKDGHTIYGWDFDENGENPAIADADGNLNISEDTLLYPRLSPIARTVVNGDKASVTVTKNDDGTFTIDVDGIDAPEKEGFAFVGWYTEPNYINPISGVTNITRDTELYPRFRNITPPAQMLSGDHILYVYGYPDGEVKPNGNITREEVAAIFCRLLDPEYRATIETDENPFPDVESTRWSNHDISTMAKGGFIVGDENGNFNPGNPITRAEFTVIASKFASVDTTAENIFKDIEGHWAKDYILKATSQSWITGYEDRTFRPQNKITRAEAITIVNSMLVRYGDVDAEFAKQWPDLSKSDWYYDEMIEATTYHGYTRNEDGWSEKWFEK